MEYSDFRMPASGIQPSSVVTPPGTWRTVLEFLQSRFPHVHDWLQRMQCGQVLNAQGHALPLDSPFVAQQRIYYYRNVAQETPIPFAATVLAETDHFIVVDKPHFLPVTPSGKYLQETVLVRLKKAYPREALSPIHRIDRDTTGLVLFARQTSSRNPYQTLFRERKVHKVYECVAPWNPHLSWPIERHSRIVQASHFMQQEEQPGAPNAVTRITPLETAGAWARYRLEPLTGQRHQLRVHMAALGLPIKNDGIYPTLTPEGACDWSAPLQLLALSIAFTDPFSGEACCFSSQQTLLPL